MAMATVETRAVRLAAAMRCNVLLGARPFGKGWFAHCDGEEVDGGNPTQALDGLVEVLRRREEKVAREHAASARLADQRLQDIANDVSASGGNGR